MRLITIFVAALAFFCVAFQAIAGECTRSEQRGCLEIQVNNLVYTDDLMDTFLSNSRADASLIMYRLYKGGKADSAGTTSFCFYMWNVGALSVSDMASYATNRSNGANPPRITLEEISVMEGPAGRTEFTLGPPDRGFRFTTSDGVGSIQFPWDAVQIDTYTLTCACSGVSEYPGRDKGHWLTPKDFKRYKRERRDGLMVSFFF